METKFISFDGFGEIENLVQPSKKIKACAHHAQKRELSTAQKTVRFVKRAAALYSGKKPASGSKKAAPRRTGAAQSSRSALNKSTARPLGNELKVIDRRYHTFNYVGADVMTIPAAQTAKSKSSRYAHLAPQETRSVKLIKSKALLAGVACLSAVMVSCLTVASALGTDGGTNGTNESAAYVTVATGDEAVSAVNAEASAISASCSSLYIDGSFIGATEDTDALNAALEQVLEDYKEGYDEQTTTEFANSVEVVAGNGAGARLVTVDELMELASGKFSISLSTDIVYTREVEYDTDVEYDEDEPSTYEEVKTEGENGEEEVTVRTTFVDGVQTNAEVTDTEVIKEAVNEVIVKGSSNGVSSDDSDDEAVSASSSSMFKWPLPYTHTLSSYFGQRWGRLHGGIDISDSNVYGQSICAAASGTVTFAGSDDSGYGTYVIIDHGNGYVTLYGHCSALAVSAGQTVSQGDVIAYVGSTGNSTGPHLHFEIRIDGEKVDPLDYVS